MHTKAGEAPQIPQEDFKYNQFIEAFKCASMSSKVGVALFGAGRAGMIHLRNIMANPRCDLMYVVEASDERNKQVQASMGLTTTKFVNLSRVEDVMNDPDVKAVVITTPTPTHFDIVVQSLKNGKAVFCEKPIGNAIGDVKKCYDLANDVELPLYCAFNRRFDPSYSNLESRVKKGELGKVHMIKSCSRDSPLPSIDYLRTSSKMRQQMNSSSSKEYLAGGIFQDCAVHDIDIVCWVLGEYPSKVYASAQAHMQPIAEIDDHDTVAIHLTFPSGAMACIDLSRFAPYGYDQRLEAFGPGGMLLCQNQTALGVQSYKPEGVQEAPIWHSFPSRYDEAYKGELEHFLNVLEGKEKMLVKANETLSVCRVASACEESVRTGMPVKVNYEF